MVVAHAEWKEIEFHTQGALEDIGAETQVATSNIIGVAAFNMAIINVEAEAQTLIIVVTYQTSEAQLRHIIYMLAIEVTNIVHATGSEPNLCLAEPYLGMTCLNSGKKQYDNY